MNEATAVLPTPSFARHLFLLWQLRLHIGLNQRGQRSPVLAVGAFAALTLPSVGMGWLFFQILQIPAVAQSNSWPPFILNLLCFVTAAVWCVWPILSAGVDDHSELSRYAAFPVSSVRLLTASTLATLLEPRALFFYGPVVGAALGYARVHPIVAPGLAVALFVAFTLLNAAWSRAGLHLVLNVLSAERNAEIIGGSSLLMLLGASLIPPIDTRWLTHLGQGGIVLGSGVLENAALALSRVPPGFFGAALEHLAQGDVRSALWDGFGIGVFAALGFASAYLLLRRFHLRATRGGPQSRAESSDPFARTGSSFSTLFVREALDLWRNPRARLLVAVPFILAILLKLLSGRALFLFALGNSADAWVMGSLCLYGTVVIGATFSQNMFAYDGQGMAVFLSAPVELAEVVRAKNLLHFLSATTLALAVSLFYRVYFGHGTFWDWACAMAGVAALVPVLLTAGNFLSLHFPVKFHANLKRRDKLPFLASMLGVAGAGVGSAPFSFALRSVGREPVNGRTALQIALCAALAWMVYRALLPRALATLYRRRERVLRAITRD